MSAPPAPPVNMSTVTLATIALHVPVPNNPTAGVSMGTGTRAHRASLEQITSQTQQRARPAAYANLLLSTDHSHARHPITPSVQIVPGIVRRRSLTATSKGVSVMLDT